MITTTRTHPGSLIFVEPKRYKGFFCHVHDHLIFFLIRVTQKLCDCFMHHKLFSLLPVKPCAVQQKDVLA